MSTTTNLKEIASINLSFAQAEIGMCDDSESISRAINHVQQALACLSILAPEFSAPDDASEEAA